MRPTRLVLPLLLFAATALAAAAAPTFVAVDLQPQANQSLNDNFHGTEGNHLMDVPRGEQKLLGVPYTIGEKCVHVRGNGGAKELPEAIAGIKLDQPAA